MKHARHTLLLSLAILVFVVPAFSCGPDWPEAVFVRRYGPDTPYSAFAAGRLGIPQPEFRVRNLAIAYAWLTGHGPAPAQRKQAEAVDTYFVSHGNEVPSPNAEGITAWISARKAFDQTGAPSNRPEPTTDFSRSVPGDQYNHFTNCLDDAFATAARTLSARSKQYGATSPGVVEWVRGQDMVFANCTDGSAIPSASNVTPWLQKDRAYQIAAAQFYSLQYDAAAASFRAIAGDTSSPWSTLSRYLVARTLLRKASLAFNPYADDAQKKTQPTQAQTIAAFTSVRTDLLAMRAEARMAPLRPAIDNLLDLVNARIDPEKQSVILAARLLRPAETRYSQALIDLTYTRTAYPFAYPDPTPQSPRSHPAPQPATPADRDGADLIAWMNAVSTANESAALEHWRSGKQNAWLLAALMFAKPTDPATPELLRAAAVSSDSSAAAQPGFAAITYHRLRLLPPAELASSLPAIMPRIEKSEGPSTVNLYAQLRAKGAPTLSAWLADAGRIPAATEMEGDEDALDTKPVDQVCGPQTAEANLRLFTPQAAAVLNARLPLARLADAAEASVLPPNLRFAVAQTAWTRAVLLNQPAIARRMSPILIGCRPAWKPVLDAYDNSSAEDDRHANGLLALMRFASTEPNVRAGEPRPDGFATYSSFRDNWWCSTTPLAPSPTGPKPLPAEQDPDLDPHLLSPFFLSAADRTAAAPEVNALRAIPAASDYFATEALAWVAAHPRDSRNADLLGEALRVERNACSDDATRPLAKRLFETIHRTYPQSTWAKKYTTYE